MAQGRKTRVVIDITLEQRALLTAWPRSTTRRAGLATRGRLILMLADGASISHLARTVDIRRRLIDTWAERFRQPGIAGVHDQAGRGRKPCVPPPRRQPSGAEGVRAA